MSKRQLLMLIGVWMIVFLFLGFPSFWDKILSILAGILTITIAYKMRPPQRVISKDSIPFVEHKASDITNNIQ